MLLSFLLLLMPRRRSAFPVFFHSLALASPFVRSQSSSVPNGLYLEHTSRATARFIFLFDSSGWLRLLSISKSSKNLSIVSSLRCLRFSKRIIAWCPCALELKRFNKISKIFSAVSRCYCFLAITQFRAVPSWFPVRALHSCLSHKSSSSKCSFITSIQVSIQPSSSCL